MTLHTKNGPMRVAAIRRRAHVTFTPTPYMLAQKPRMKRTRWLARLCWQILHNIGALKPYEERIETYTFDECVQTRLTDKIMWAADAIFSRDLNPDDYVVVMGEDELLEVWREMEMVGRHISMMTGEYRYNREGYRAQVLGLRVHAVAGLSGMALIPKVLVEKAIPMTSERGK
jgi:hypothetical protein